MATFYSFQFIPLNSIVKIKMHPADSFKKNKDLTIVEKFLSIPEAVDEIIKQLTNFLKDSSSSQSDLNNGQRIFLTNLTKKLSFKVPSRREEEDEDKEEDSELSFEESEFMIKSLEILLTESATTGLTFDEETKKVGNLIPENQKKTVIKIKLNVLRGFLNGETPYDEEFDGDKHGTFICKKHQVTATHFCKTCNQFACGFDMFPDKDAQEESCKNHELLTIYQYQLSMEQSVSGFVSKIEEFNATCQLCIEKEMEDLPTRKKKNEETKKNLEELSQKMKSILSMKKTDSKSPIQRFDAFHEKLDAMMNIEMEFKTKFEKSVIEKNPRYEIESLENHIETLKKDAQEKDQKFNKMIEKLLSIMSLITPQMEILQKFVEQSIGKTDLLEWSLLYRASRDGFGAGTFHSRCDKANRTLVIIKATNGSIFGGFTTKRWNSANNNYVKDEDAFIFLLKLSPYQELLKKTYEPKRFSPTLNAECAIHCDPAYGPKFGAGTDLCICSNSNSESKSYSNLNITYDAGLESDEAKTYLCGNSTFQTSEIEVYTM